MSGIDRRTFLCATATVGAVAAVGVTLETGVAAAAEHATPKAHVVPMIGQWGGYSNGEISLSAMTYLGRTGDGTDLYLRPDAAGSLGRMQAAYHSQTGGSLTINEGYRDLATQWYYWNLYQSGQGNVAAYPGTSNHGWALAADFNLPGDQFSWLQNNAAAYGWSWETGQASGEPWHWEYVLDDAPPENTQVFETAHNSGWQPMPVSSITASKVSAVVRADGTKIIYTVRDGAVFEAASNAGWQNLRVPNLDGVSAVSAIAVGSGVVLYTIRSGAVWECASGDWTPYAVGYNGSPIYADAVSAVLRSDGTKIIYTVRDGGVYEAASNTGWQNLRVPNLDSVAAVSAISRDGNTTLYTIRAGALWETSSVDWRLYAVGYDGNPIYGNAVSALYRPDGTRIVYTLRDGAVYEAASNTGWQNLRVPNLGGVGSVSAIYTSGTEILYTR